LIGNSEVAAPHEFPWLVELGIKGEHEGLGAVLNESYVVTAASLVSKASPADLVIIAGDHDVSSVDGSEQSRLVFKIIPHPDYEPATGANDVAVLQVSPPLVLGDMVAPADLPATGTAAAASATLAGWGAINDGSEPALLRKVAVALTDQDPGALPRYKDAAPRTDDYGAPVVDGRTLVGLAIDNDSDPADGFRVTPIAAHVDWLGQHS